jgi:amino acid adenylation domain-containing protein
LYSQKIAIKFKNTFLTYNDLNIKSDKLANHLLKHNIEGNAIIGVCMERCPNLIISILGILKAGFVYLPIDQTYPDERIKYIVNNSKTPLLIIDDNTKRYNLPTLDISKEDYLIENRISVYKDNKNNAAYLLYTSGSTGNPKGAINTHKGLINRISWMTKELGYDKNTIFIQKTPFSFDVSLWELILPFTIGATLIIPTPNSHKDINYLIAVIIKEKIDTIHFVPSMLNIFLSNKNASKCVSLKSIICSGEILTLSTSKKCFEVLPDINLYNLYGPTETAIDVTFFKVEKENILGINSIPIGKPIDNIGVHIISQDNIELPIGVKGELLITGIGVASGYYGDSELTGEKFIKNPFNSEFPYTQAYKSGDYAKIDEFGNIIFGGRIDNQVKLHGQRVELREIENLIRKISSIHEVHVNISSNLNNLVAFYKSDTNIDIEILKDGLRRILPKYMIPCIFSRVDSFPLSDNGKLDFKKLDNMLLQQSIDEIIIAPKDERESELLSTFKKVLNNENIGVEHDFFEYGGDSLGAMFIISEYEKINLDILYKFRTVRKIIENKNKQQQDSILKKLAHNDRNKLNLICIPYGGGNSYAYNDMIKFIPNDLNLFAVDLPGHHLGNRDKDLCNFKEISIKVAQEIIVNGIDNIYMYGHCTGSAIAVEIGKIIEETSNISIHKIVVGGTYPFLSLKDDIFFPENQDTYSFIKSMGGFKGDIKKDYQEQMIKWFIHDVSEARKYFEEYQNNKVKLKLKTPLTCITSKEDPFTKKADHSIKNWEYVSYQTSYSELDRGDHYFINAYPNEILNIILE